MGKNKVKMRPKYGQNKSEIRPKWIQNEAILCMKLQNVK